ncbi:diguanylate cyclase [Nitrosomonas sp.]|uniref:diguanylate cyclase n=1 Tax=Nitrosomonas sp. TaxID=42353 RepID=UPI0025DB150F|nr:diguanylate cyclase [Nitrosomonas sp.]MBY0485527.1 diguanylate cyclase [Nitrosomonas sp.]
MRKAIIHSTTRISIALVAVLMSVLLMGELLGIVPDKSQLLLEARKSFSRTVAAQFALAAERNDFKQIKAGLNLIIQSNPEIRSAAIRRPDGSYFATVGDHAASWRSVTNQEKSADKIQVSIMQNDQVWGVVELSFISESDLTDWGGIKNSFWSMLIYIAIACFIGYLFLLKRILKHLDPSKVVPERVRRAFDTLSEGILILSEDGQIVLANKAFCEQIGLHITMLLGRKASELDWSMDYKDQALENRTLPWLTTLRNGKSRTNERLKYQFGGVNPHIFNVNCTEILGDDNVRKGVLVTFDDITELEYKNLELESMLKINEQSMQEISRKNDELKILAENDPMTRCYNRRAFHAYGDKIFEGATSHHKNLVCIMLDIDHFKSVNDTYGHQTGDSVIKLVANIAKENLRETDIVGRYGGEEFCLMLPNITNEMALEIAERLRFSVENSSDYKVIGIKRVTISLGLASIQFGIHNQSELISLADKALYLAKKNGRNRVVVWNSELDSKSQAISA